MKKFLPMILIAVCILFLFTGCAKKQDGWYDEDSFRYTISISNYTYVSNTSTVYAYLIFGNDGRETMTDYWITVAFYDSGNEYITTKEVHSAKYIDKGEEKEVMFYFYFTGEAKYCELIDVACDYEDFSTPIPFIVWIMAALFAWLLLGIIFNAKTRYYKHGNHTIKVYAGWSDHHLEIDGQVVDREKNMFAFSIRLTGTVDSHSVKVKIGQGFLGNTITVFIDDEEAKPIPKKSHIF